MALYAWTTQPSQGSIITPPPSISSFSISGTIDCGTLNASTAVYSPNFGTGSDMTIHPSNSNELNFGGTNTSTTIWFGYRTWGSRPVPTEYNFGPSKTATINAGTMYSNARRVLTGASVGSTTRGIYTDSNGYAQLMTYSLNATVNSGTTDHIVYYNSANSIKSDPYITRDSQTLIINRSTEAVALGFRLKNKPTSTNGYSVMFHLAASGNRGIFEDSPLGGWLMYWTTSNVAYIPYGGLWVGNSGLTSECNVGCEAKAGRVYLYSQGTDSGTMGIYSTGQAIIYRNHAGTLYLGNTIYGSHYYMSHSCYVNYNNDSNYGVFIGSTGNNNSGARVRNQTHLNTVSMWIDGSGTSGLYHNASVSGPSGNRWLIQQTSSGTVATNVSDKRSKIDKGMLDKNETLNILNELPVINFVYKEDVENNNLEQSGIYAQDLRDILLKYNYPNRNIILLSPIITDEDYSDQKIKLAEEFRRINIDQNLNLDENSEEYKEKEEIYFRDHLIECEKDGRIEYDLELPEEEYEYNINYTAMIPYLIKGWQIQQEQITQQQTTIQSLESRIAQLEQIILNQNN